jgi:hypothetical protein
MRTSLLAYVVLGPIQSQDGDKTIERKYTCGKENLLVLTRGILSDSQADTPL